MQTHSTHTIAMLLNAAISISNYFSQCNLCRLRLRVPIHIYGIYKMHVEIIQLNFHRIFDEESNSNDYVIDVNRLKHSMKREREKKNVYSMHSLNTFDVINNMCTDFMLPSIIILCVETYRHHQPMHQF